jgi:hypothetical protein
MKTKLLMMITMVFLFPGISMLYAQETVDASGGEAAGTGGTISNSVGQVAVSVLSGAAGTVLQGVQQPWEVFLVTGLNTWNELTLDCTIYPNPAGDFLKLKVEGWNREKLSYRLYDISGKMYGNGQVTAPETTIPLAALLSGAYLLSITREADQQIQSFKIVKN